MHESDAIYNERRISQMKPFETFIPLFLFFLHPSHSRIEFTLPEMVPCENIQLHMSDDLDITNTVYVQYAT